MDRQKRSLYFITSGKQTLDEVYEIVRAAARGGIDYLQIREKHLTALEMMNWVERLATIFPLERILINDRVDVAVASDCAGSHLAYHSLAPTQAKRVLRPHQLAGRSVHSAAEAITAVRQGADYLIYGHLYPSQSKPGLPARGTAGLFDIVRAVLVPVIAIGGIRPEHVPEVLAAGCAGIAVLSGITDADEPEKSARAYRDALDCWEGIVG